MSRGTYQRLEKILADRLNRRHCVLTGRAASAIHIALRALELPPGKIVVPAITCPSPASVPLYSGHQPLFCDISLSNFNICPNALRRLLEEHKDVVAIMPVHLYGVAAPMPELMAIASDHRLPIIENAAQALGGTLKGRPLGSWGDISIISFGHTKTIDVGWGGAALTDDDHLALRLRGAAAVLPSKPLHIDRLFEEWRRVYYSLISLTEINPALHELFVPLPDIFKEMYLFALNDTGAREIFEALNNLNDYAAARRSNTRAYRVGLEHHALRHQQLTEEDVPWRYSFIVPPRLQKLITQTLRNAKIDASNWYPTLHRWYVSGRRQGDSCFPNACALAAGVVNLWVAPDLPKNRVEQTCEIIQKIVAELE